MKATEIFAEIVGQLEKQGLPEAELFLKQGRSRRFEIGIHGRRASSSTEQGWAVRAGGSRSSLYVAGTGLPDAGGQWPEPDGQPLRLPEAVPIPVWRRPTDLDEALVAESEALALMAGIETALVDEIPGSRLIRGHLEEGTSETTILSSRGIEVSYKSRGASLYLEVAGPWSGAGLAGLSVAERQHQAFHPPGIAGRLANRLLLGHRGEAPAKERGEVLIGSAVTARILEGLLPLLVGAEAEALARSLTDRRGRVGCDALTIVDDGRLEGGVLAGPVDGEGLPTGARVLIEEGQFRQPLVDWRDGRDHRPTLGCCRRDSWRDLPRPAASHLFLGAARAVPVGDLVASVARGHYLLEPMGTVQVDFATDRFRLPVCGFVLRQGRATSPISGTWLEGGISTLLHNIRGVARDLTFEPAGAMIGAPTILVGGLGLSGMD